jgi:hypothetical protein
MNQGTGKKVVFSLFILICVVVLIASCGGGGGDGSNVGSGGNSTNTSQLKGTAAAGSPIVGTINVRGANGVTSLSAIEADGSFVVDIDALTSPFIVWAEGFANGQEVELYTTAYTDGYVNCTSATHAVMAMALNEDPVTFYNENPNADPPPEAEFEESEQTITQILASVFDTLDMPADFDLSNGEFTADGTGFDALLDVLNFECDALSDTVTMSDASTGTVLYEENMSTGEVTAEASSEEAQQVIGFALGRQAQIEAIMNQFENLWDTHNGLPGADAARATMLPVMSDDFLEEGLGAGDHLDFWTDPLYCSGPHDVFDIQSVKIIKEMGTVSAGGYTYDELEGNYAGCWAIVTIIYRGRTYPYLTTFIQPAEGTAWLWHGNRVPFLGGGDVESEHVYTSGTGWDNLFSGLEFHAEDEGNLAYTNKGIVSFLVQNPALPNYTFPQTHRSDSALVVSRTSDIDPEYRITNVNTIYWSTLYTEQDGLDIGKITNSDFLFMAFRDDDGTAVPVAAWYSRLKYKPKSVLNGELTTGMFASILYPTNLSALNVPGSVQINWTNPPGTSTVDIGFGFGDADGNHTSYDYDSDCDGDDISALVSHTFDTAGTLVYPPVWAEVEVEVMDDEGIEYKRLFWINN